MVILRGIVNTDEGDITDEHDVMDEEWFIHCEDCKTTSWGNGVTRRVQAYLEY